MTGLKSRSESKIAQLRENLRRHLADSDVSRLLALLDARLDQDQLIDPANDSAVSYFAQARKAGALASDLQTRGRDLVRRALRDDAAFGEHKDLRGKTHHRLHHMLYHQDGHAAVGDVADHRHHVADFGWIEARQHFVEQHWDDIAKIMPTFADEGAPPNSQQAPPKK